MSTTRTQFITIPITIDIATMKSRSPQRLSIVKASGMPSAIDDTSWFRPLHESATSSVMWGSCRNVPCL